MTPATLDAAPSKMKSPASPHERLDQASMSEVSKDTFPKLHAILERVEEEIARVGADPDKELDRDSLKSLLSDVKERGKRLHRLYSREVQNHHQIAYKKISDEALKNPSHSKELGDKKKERAEKTKQASGRIDTFRSDLNRRIERALTLLRGSTSPKTHPKEGSVPAQVLQPLVLDRSSERDTLSKGALVSFSFEVKETHPGSKLTYADVSLSFKGNNLSDPNLSDGDTELQFRVCFERGMNIAEFQGQIQELLASDSANLPSDAKTIEGSPLVAKLLAPGANETTRDLFSVPRIRAANVRFSNSQFLAGMEVVPLQSGTVLQFEDNCCLDGVRICQDGANNTAVLQISDCQEARGLHVDFDELLSGSQTLRTNALASTLRYKIPSDYLFQGNDTRGAQLNISGDVISSGKDSPKVIAEMLKDSIFTDEQLYSCDMLQAIRDFLEPVTEALPALELPVVEFVYDLDRNRLTSLGQVSPSLKDWDGVTPLSVQVSLADSSRVKVTFERHEKSGRYFVKLDHSVYHQGEKREGALQTHRKELLTTDKAFQQINAYARAAWSSRTLPWDDEIKDAHPDATPEPKKKEKSGGSKTYRVNTDRDKRDEERERKERANRTRK